MASQSPEYLSPRASGVNLYDALAYELRPGICPTPRGIFTDFTEGFPRFVAQEASSGDTQASELHEAIKALPPGHIELFVNLDSRQDWSCDKPVEDVSSLFATLQILNNVFNVPDVSYQDSIEAFNADSNPSEAPLVKYTRWLFRNHQLSVRHGYFWEKFIQTALAMGYVRERAEALPPEVMELTSFGSQLLDTANESATMGEDTRDVGIRQILGSLILSLREFEKTDARWDFTLRLAAASAISAVARDNPDDLLTILTRFIQPTDVDIAQVSGAVFKPVVLVDVSGAPVFKDFQRFDSFYFKPPEETPDIPQSKPNFPQKPQIIREYYPEDDGLPENKRVTLYKDPSYFDPQGFKVYWGDLSPRDVAEIPGTFYCLSQYDSFHRIPEWATLLEDPTAQDPNRPAHSLLNTDSSVLDALPANPVLLRPDYVRAVAVGAITNGRFVENHRRATITFARTV